MNIEAPVEVSGSAPEEESHIAVIRWTRQAGDTYLKEGSLPADIPTARVCVVDEDYETNPHGVCPGLNLRPKEEAIALVEQKIADGSYREWRYELRPEVSSDETAPAQAVVVPPDPPEYRLCANQRCKKGPNGAQSVVKSRRAKYCCASCRVAVSRREGTPRPKGIEKPMRKRRKVPVPCRTAEGIPSETQRMLHATAHKGLPARAKKSLLG